MAEDSKLRETPNVLMAAAHIGERREVRYAIPVAIVVTGTGRNGQMLHEPTVTTNISEWGCAFPLSVELAMDDIIAVRVTPPAAPESARQSLFQVVRVTPQEGGWIVGAWKIDNEGLWGADLGRTAQPDEGNRELRNYRDAKYGPRLRRNSDE
jgi:hypothetical protein